MESIVINCPVKCVFSSRDDCKICPREITTSVSTVPISIVYYFVPYISRTMNVQCGNAMVGFFFLRRMRLHRRIDRTRLKDEGRYSSHPDLKWILKCCIGVLPKTFECLSPLASSLICVHY